MKILEKRASSGRDYLIALERNLQADWNELYLQFLDGNLSLPESMTLIHPAFYEHYQWKNRIVGNRNFPREQGLMGVSCSAVKIWGYDCTLNVQRNIAADHIFPYSMGGPTHSGNKLYLCKIHNELKGNDIHLYPWEQGPPNWLKDLLEKIKIVISRNGLNTCT